MVAHLVLAAALLLQQGPEITVGVRPQALRVGGRAVLSVRVLSSGALPDWVEFIPPVGLEVADIRDRSSRGVGTGGGTRWALDREIHLLAREAGEYELPPAQVVVEGAVFQVACPRITVAAVPLRWAPPPADPNRDTRETDLPPAQTPRSQGAPPPTGEMHEAHPAGGAGYAPWGYGGYPPWGYPGGWYGYPPSPYGPNGGWPVGPPGAMPGVGGAGIAGGWPSYPPGTLPGTPPPGGSFPGTAPMGTGSGWTNPPTLRPPPGGQWPGGMGGGWAETAAGDPWWPEIVPELFGYGATAQGAGGEATLSAGVTPPRVFEGQQLTLVATAAFRPGAFLGSGLAPEYLPPSPPDFWAVDLPEAMVADAVASGGGVDQAFTFRRALFPMRPGEHLIPPVRLLLPRSGTDPRATGWDTLAADPLPVTVLPVPRTNGLPGYAGAVGRYRMEAGVTPTRLAVGETAILVVRILGVGNIPTVPPPELGPVYGAEVQAAGDGAVMEVRDGVVGGVRTFTWLVVPTQPGPLHIGPVLFGYFDPYLGDFGQASSQELILEVTEFPGGQGGNPTGAPGVF